MSNSDRWLQSSETGKPFSHCIHCRMPLLETDTSWVVNKEFHQDECTIEYAICMHCRDEVFEQLSDESKKAVSKFLEEEIPWAERTHLFLHTHSIDQRLEKCIICDAAQSQSNHYSTTVLFDQSGEPIIGTQPLMMCGNCADRLQGVLSKATRESWDRFMRDHFAGPPEMSYLPSIF